MEKLPKMQHAVLINLYLHFLEDGEPRPYVKVSRVSIFTMRALYRGGFIDTSKLFGGYPSNMIITKKGIEYGKGMVNIRTIDRQDHTSSPYVSLLKRLLTK